MDSQHPFHQDVQQTHMMCESLSISQTLPTFLPIYPVQSNTYTLYQWAQGAYV